MLSLKARKALVTGSSRGIGLAIADALSRQGAEVCVHASAPGERLESAVNSLRSNGGRVESVSGDLSDPAVPARLIRETEDKLGPLDILVLNASLQIRAGWREAKREEFIQQMQVNVWSCLDMIQQAAPGMAERGRGRILTLGSVQQDRPAPPLPVYAASKAALMNLVRSIALDLAPSGVTVNNLSPGLIETDRNLMVRDTPDKQAQLLRRVPVGFMGQPEDCVGAALVLCSDAGRYVTGADWRVDGAWGLTSAT
ncbi:MAG: SDR family oxidoreductase [Kiritimatiellia bacterium]